jgi:putative FmdB family regulatory protein
MPTYEYKREDGSTFEYEQRITDDALTECPTTGQKVKRLISGGAGLVFKGSGFYLTDYARKSSSPSTSGGSDSGSSNSDSSSSNSSSKESSSKETSSKDSSGSSKD